ncbi:MAG: family 16 glycoside hydrolase, partial [Bacteroidota bacterium]
MTKKISLHVMAILMLLCFGINLNAQNKLSDEEKADGFVLLFDGKTSDGWRGFQKDVFPDRWIIEDGTIHFDPKAEGSRGDIIIDKMYSNFHL